MLNTTHPGLTNIALSEKPVHVRVIAFFEKKDLISCPRREYCAKTRPKKHDNAEF